MWALSLRLSAQPQGENVCGHESLSFLHVQDTRYLLNHADLIQIAAASLSTFSDLGKRSFCPSSHLSHLLTRPSASRSHHRHPVYLSSIICQNVMHSNHCSGLVLSASSLPPRDRRRRENPLWDSVPTCLSESCCTLFSLQLQTRTPDLGNM